MKNDIEPKGRGVSDIMNDLHEVIDELWHNHPPRVTVKGWWWKRHFSYFRAKVEVLQSIIDEEWRKNGPELREKITDAVRQEVRKGFINDKRF